MCHVAGSGWPGVRPAELTDRLLAGLDRTNGAGPAGSPSEKYLYTVVSLPLTLRAALAR